MSWAWDFMLRTPDAVYGSKQEGLHVSMALSLLNTKKLIRTEMDTWRGRLAGATPRGGGRKSKKRTRSAAEAPGPGSFYAASTSAAPAPFVGRGPSPGPGPRHRLGRDSSRSARSERPLGPGPKRLKWAPRSRTSTRSFGSSGRARQSGAKSFRNFSWSPRRTSPSFCASSSSLSVVSCVRPAAPGPDALSEELRFDQEKRAMVPSKGDYTRSCRVGGSGVPVSRLLWETLCPSEPCRRLHSGRARSDEELATLQREHASLQHAQELHRWVGDRALHLKREGSHSDSQRTGQAVRERAGRSHATSSRHPAWPVRRPLASATAALPKSQPVRSTSRNSPRWERARWGPGPGASGS